MKNFVLSLALTLLCSATYGQLGRRLQDAAAGAAERAATQQTERRTEEAVNRAIDEVLDGSGNNLNQQQQQSQPQQNQQQQQSQPQQSQPQQPAIPAPSQSAAEKTIPFERGSYVEVTNAMGMELIRTVYFDRWGEWTSTEDKSEIRLLGFTSKTHNIEIVKGTTHWKIDMIEMTGTRYEDIELDAATTAVLAATTGEQLTEGMEITELGNENYLGYTCKKVNVKHPAMQMDVTILTYGNLSMHMEGTIGGFKVANQITSINLNAPPAAVFEIPAGVIIDN